MNEINWTLEYAKKLAHSFPTPLHRMFQLTCGEVDRCRAEIHRLRSKLSQYERLESWSET